MIAALLCLAAFATCFGAGRRSLWGGFIVTIGIGYAYGIVRANLDRPATHFLFDCAAAGFYLSLLTRSYTAPQRYRVRRLMPWFMVLTAWPVLLFMVPIQDPLIQLVGLRGQIFFLPFMLVGAMLEERELDRIAFGLALLNIGELAVALAEIVFGLPRFFPFNPDTELIYRSMDVFVGGVGHFRLPGTFVQSAAYGGNMVAALPLLSGALVRLRRGDRRRRLFLAAIAASMAGVFLSASRSQAIILMLLIAAIAVSNRRRFAFPRRVWIGLFAVVVLLIVMVPRMQRFLTLSNTSFVRQRIEESINSSIFKLAWAYPLGNGLGGGGTSIPYFLQKRLRNPVALENQYVTIMLEEGLPGLALWFAFIAWTLTRPLPRVTDPWYTGRRLARLLITIWYLTAPLGNGLFTSIPGSAFVFLFTGWTAVPVFLRRDAEVQQSRVAIARDRAAVEPA